eukprot:1967302-Pleurochrysis_carterae.AAC.3
MQRWRRCRERGILARPSFEAAGTAYILTITFTRTQARDLVTGRDFTRPPVFNRLITSIQCLLHAPA